MENKNKLGENKNKLRTIYPKIYEKQNLWKILRTGSLGANKKECVCIRISNKGLIPSRWHWGNVANKTLSLG